MEVMCDLACVWRLRRLWLEVTVVVRVFVRAMVMLLMLVYIMLVAVEVFVVLVMCWCGGWVVSMCRALLCVVRCVRACRVLCGVS